MNNLSNAAPKGAVSLSFAKAKDLKTLNSFLLTQVETLLVIWTGRKIERKGNEIWFVNTTRNDNQIGSCSINVAKKKASTGCFNDFGDESFTGRGLIELYSKLNGLSLDEAYQELNKQYPNPNQANAYSSKLLNGHELTTPVEVSKPKPKPEPTPIDEEDESIELPPNFFPIDKDGTVAEVTARYPYYLKTGELLFYQNRIEYQIEEGETLKTFCPCYYSNEKQKWVRAFPKGVLPLYNTNAITKGKTVIVVEGEKCTDYVKEHFPDYACVTSCKGSGNATKSDWTVIEGHDIVIIPDCDDAGYNYAAEVTALCWVNQAKSIQIVDVKKLGWEAGEDIADQAKDQLTGLLDNLSEPKDSLSSKALDEAFYKACALLTRGDYDRVKRAIANYLNIGIHTLTAGRKDWLGAVTGFDSDSVETEAEPELTEEQLLEFCRHIAEQPLEKLEGYLQQVGLVEERQNAKLIFAAIHSAHFDKPTSAVTKGESGSGKSTVVEKVVPLFPPDFVYKLTTGSNLSFVYEAQGRFVNTTIILAEAGALTAKSDGSNNTFLEIMKVLLSEHRIEHKVVETDELGSKHTVTYSQDGPANLITTTTRYTLDHEIETRLLSTASTVNKSRRKAILASVSDATKGESKQPPNLLDWHCFSEWVRKGTNQVVIPFINHITETMPVEETRALRDFNNLVGLIKTFALVNRLNRQLDEHGRLLAEPEDYREAYFCIGEKIELEHELKTDDKQQVFIKDFVNLVEKQGIPIDDESLLAQRKKILGVSSNAIEKGKLKTPESIPKMLVMSVRETMRMMGYKGFKTFHRLLQDAVYKGLLIKVSAGRGGRDNTSAAYTYPLDWEARLSEKIEGLIKPDILEARLKK